MCEIFIFSLIVLINIIYANYVFYCRDTDCLFGEFYPLSQRSFVPSLESVKKCSYWPLFESKGAYYLLGLTDDYLLIV